nr:putative late blight resistance protein homolog R1B-14 [Ipomoea batatas]
MVEMAAYAAVVSLINRLNSSMHFNPIQLGRFTSECSNSDGDREALESVFPAANREGLLPNVVSLSRRLDELLNSQQMREYLQLLCHYNLCFPTESLRMASLSLNLPGESGFANKHFQYCDILIQAWERLDDYLIHQWNIQDFKQSVCLLEAFLSDHPPVNKNDRKKIQVLAHKAENLIDSLTSDINLEYQLRVYKMKKKFDHLTETKWQYEWSTMCTSVFTASHSLCSSTSRNTMPLETNLDIKYLRESSSIHSFIGFGRVRTLFNFSLMLRVLDLSFQPFNSFPMQVLYSESLRYLALASFDDLPQRLPLLRHLQTLVRHCHEATLILPVQIWKMKRLRHLYFKKSCRLQIPPNMRWFLDSTHLLRFDEENHLCMPKLQTLSNLSFGSCSEEILTRIPNLKKLGLREDEGERLSDEQLLYCLNNLKVLCGLVTLKCFFTKQRPLPMPDAFPPNLKHLTLQGCRRPWKEMSILSALPKLEVLKLKDCAFEGSEWDLTEEEVFYQLKAMVIDIADLEQWEACSIHFPNLQSLVLKYCQHLKEIPIGIGDINTLQLIELWACSSSANDSAERIQEEQQNLGNDGLTIKIHSIPNGKWQSIFSKFVAMNGILNLCAPHQQRILKQKYKLRNSHDDLNLEIRSEISISSFRKKRKVERQKGDMAAYAAIVSLMNALNEYMRFNLTEFLLNLKYKWDEDREALESVFLAANGEDGLLLPNIDSLVRRLDELLSSLQFKPHDCPRKYVEFLYHYNLNCPREALRNFCQPLKLNLPNQKITNKSRDCYQLQLGAWIQLDEFLIHQCHIKNLKQSVCLVEAFLRDHPPMNKNDGKQILVRAQNAEALIDIINESESESLSHSMLYKMQKEFVHD